MEGIFKYKKVETAIQNSIEFNAKASETLDNCYRGLKLKCSSGQEKGYEQRHESKRNRNGTDCEETSTALLEGLAGRLAPK